MTIKFDDRAKHQLAIQPDIFGLINKSNDIKVSEIAVKEVSVSSIRGIIATNHYSGLMPDSTVICFAGIYNNKIVGVIAFGVGTSPSQYRNIIPTIQDGEYLELTRLWCSDESPKNTESKIVSSAMKLLPKKVKLIVSYADPSQGHLGYIYQATNFYYCGMTQKGKRLVDKKGKERHLKSLNIYKIRRPEFKDLSYKEIMNRMGWQHVENSSKHRYVFLLGSKKEKKANFALMRYLIEVYPKGNGNS